MKRIIFGIASLVVLSWLLAGPVLASAPPPTLIFYNEACSDCALLVRQSLPRILAEYGITDLGYKDYINEPVNRTLLRDKNAAWGVPFDLQRHIETFVGDKILLGGHVPEQVIRALLAPENQTKFERILVFQDEMHGNPKWFKIWDFKGEVQQLDINSGIDGYLSGLGGEAAPKSVFQQSLFWVVLTSGFLNGLHPCAFAVLLFFLSFLFTLRRTRAHIFGIGLVYIVGIYLTYFLIGMGVLKSFVISSSPFIVGKIAAGLVIALGLINLIGVLWPRFPIRLKIPAAAHSMMEKYMERASLPASFILGVLVGLCAFPCSGGVYVAILGLLGAKATYWAGVGYLALYNLMFVLLLFVALLLSANQKTLDKIADLEASNSKVKRIVVSLLMIILGAGILLWIL